MADLIEGEVASHLSRLERWQEGAEQHWRIHLLPTLLDSILPAHIEVERILPHHPRTPSIQRRTPDLPSTSTRRHGPRKTCSDLAQTLPLAARGPKLLSSVAETNVLRPIDFMTPTNRFQAPVGLGE